MLHFIGTRTAGRSMIIDGYSSLKYRKNAIKEFGRWIAENIDEEEGRTVIEYTDGLLQKNNMDGEYFFEVEEVGCASQYNEDVDEVEYEDGNWYLCIRVFLKGETEEAEDNQDVLEEVNTMNKHQEMRKEAIQDIIECLEDGYSGDYTDLHNEVFNTDYYIIGIYRAKEALREYDVFDAIEKVQEYEKEMFGEYYTDVSDPEKLVNMLYYIIGDEIIGEMSDIMDDDRVCGECGNPETNEWIIQQMKELFKDELEET